MEKVAAFSDGFQSAHIKVRPPCGSVPSPTNRV